ncbi:MAG: 2-oxoglutarate dehydrogenase, E2 component, dihydrolipoamide succinyltransferase [bacterium]|nr:2-oxoglutarate dehydrogenase, E2 component, dihydrolipoamide succinyltransferase [bacterium]MDE0437162.1 2-oxoglutarate dehydrogenase, E2 component, dihydrolipoamide succinyltransferase [bacterium]
MSTTVSMPQLGETVTEGTVLRWMKQVGDHIAADEPLVEISTDKVDTEIPSPVAGLVTSILVAEGDTIGVGTPMVVIGGESGAPAEPAHAPPVREPALEAFAAKEAPPVPERAAAPPPRPEPRPPSPAGRRPGPGQFLSPVVRRLAREHGIDPSAIEGTGRDGRVTRNDVLAYIDRMQPAVAPEPVQAAPEPPSPVVRAVEAAPAAPEGEETRKLSRLRMRIATNMVKSLQTAAHVWTSVEVDYEGVERVRQAHRQSFKEGEGFSLTYLPFIARATIDALREFPIVNSSFDLEGKKAIYHQDVNLGIAVDLNQQGLIVATVRDADDFTMRALARKIRDVAIRAREGRFKPDDVTGSTFTITNPGPYGSFMSAPVINVPNVAILSTDTVAKRPKVITTSDGQDAIAIRHIGYLGLSWDHRAFDGSTAVLFLRRIKDNLETWDWEQQLT